MFFRVLLPPTVAGAGAGVDAASGDAAGVDEPDALDDNDAGATDITDEPGVDEPDALDDTDAEAPDITDELGVDEPDALDDKDEPGVVDETDGGAGGSVGSGDTFPFFILKIFLTDAIARVIRDG